MCNNENTKTRNRKNLVVISTEHVDSLTMIMDRLQSAIRQKQYSDKDLERICYTLQVGREALRYRVAIITNSVSDLSRILEQLKADNWSNKCVFRSDSIQQKEQAYNRFGKTRIDQALRNGDMETVAQAWVNEEKVDWEQLYQGKKMRTLSLPTYLFQKTAYSLKSFLEPADKKQDLDKSVLTTFEEQWVHEGKKYSQQDCSGRVYAICSGDNGLLNSIKEEAEKQFSAAKWIPVLITSPNEYDKIFNEFKRCDGILDLCFMEGIPSETAYLRIFSLLKKAGKSELQVNKIVIAGEYDNFWQRCKIESLVGLERSLHITLPTTKFGVVFREKQLLTAQWITCLLQEFTNKKIESVFFDKDVRKVSRLNEITLKEEGGLLKNKGVCLVTGGSGKIAGIITGWLRKKYDAQVFLASRSVNESYCTDNKVHALPLDVCNPGQVTAVINNIINQYGKINGVFHAAGLEGTETLTEMDFTRFQSILLPKMNGIMNLESALEMHSVDFICCFSSIASVVGDSGSGCYAMGNRFLDCYSGGDFHNNTKRISINWPLWKEGGMHIGRNRRDDTYIKMTNQEYIGSDVGVELLDKVLKSNKRQCVLFCNKKNSKNLLLESRLKAYREEDNTTVLEKLRYDAEPVGIRRDFMAGWSAKQCIVWELEDIAADLLCISKDKINYNDDIEVFGFDSIELAKFALRIGKKFGIKITPDIFFNYSTINAISDYLLTDFQKEINNAVREDLNAVSQQRLPAYKETVSDKVTDEGQRTGRQTEDDDKIVIVGMSGRFPASYNVNELWEHIERGEDVISNAAQKRASWQNMMTEEELSSADFGKIGEIPGIAEFDPLFFEISPKDAKSMDPKQRLLLEEAWKALEDAGLGKQALQKHTVGMFVGVEDGDYRDISGDNSQILANHNSVLAARLGYFMNFKGPNMAINTACSSGLVALHEACLSIKNNECDIAVVAGVSILTTCQSYRAMRKAGMISSDGHCHAFDKKANGMVPAEAAAVIVLMKQRDAIEEKRDIYASILGSEINFDGRTNGITAPNGEIQKKLIHDAYSISGVNPERVGYIVAHGTGTKLGDPIEMNALNSAFGSMTNKKQYCAVTSIKANIGHALAASGIVNLIAMVMAMKNKLIPKSIHCEEVNEYIGWSDSPFYINRENKKWETDQGDARVGGVSAFGMSGTNVHVIVEEYVKNRKQQNNKSKAPFYLLVFSAKTKTALRRRILDLAEMIKKAPDDYDLDDLAYSLYFGRIHFNCRCAVVIPDRTAAADLLLKAASEERSPNIYYGNVDKKFEKNIVVEQLVFELTKKIKESEKIPVQYMQYLQGIAEYYCTGYEEAAEELFAGTNAAILHLPSYSFDNQDYWIEEKQQIIKQVNNETTSKTNKENEEAGSKPEALPTDKENLLQKMMQIISDILQIDASNLESTDDLNDYGFTSIGYADLAERLNEIYQTGITPDIFYSCKTVEAAAKHILKICAATEKENIKTVKQQVIIGNKPGTEKIKEKLLEDIKQILSNMLELDVNLIDEEENFSAFGLDSIGMVEYAGLISERYHTAITPDVMFNYPTLGKLTEFFLAHHKEAAESFYTPVQEDTSGYAMEKAADKEELQTNPHSRRQSNQKQDAVAVIGISGKFPGADNADELWDVLYQGKSMIREISSKRLEWQENPHNNKARVRQIGEVSDIDKFDPLFFEISPIEAECMDPRQRLLLEELWKAFEDAGYGKKEMTSGKIGLFVGAEDGEYKNLADNEMIMSNHNAGLAARLAYFLDLKGPNMVINTACSSGLVALHEACQSIRNNECDTAVAAACNLLVFPKSYDIMEKNGMLSQDSACYAFDKRANGMVPSEAVAAVVLKRLSKAEQDNDHIYAVVEASGINYDGKTNGITAPNGHAQAELIQEVYEKYHINPEKISYVVTHGTGTKLGDPIELNALNEAYRAFTSKTDFCAITSTKPNVGHSMAASGIVSFISLIMAIKNEIIPASINFQTPNPYCGWNNSPFYVNTKNRTWKDNENENRFAAVSAFGLSGTNAHVVVRSYKPREDVLQIKPMLPYLFVFSAKSKKSLLEFLEKMSRLSLEFVEQNLREISYSLLNCRMHFEHRLAFAASGGMEFFEKIQDALQGLDKTKLSYGFCYTKRKLSKEKLAEAEKLAEQCRITQQQDNRRILLDDMARYYCEGFENACCKLWESEVVTRVKLPSYAFDNESYWMHPDNEPQNTARQISYWLHNNCSDFKQQSFCSEYSVQDYFLSDHIIRGENMIPGAVYIEIARSAIAYAAKHEGPMILRNIGFLQPAVPENMAIKLNVGVSNGPEGISFKIASNDGEKIHCAGTGIPIQYEDSLKADIHSLKKSCIQRISAEDCYNHYRNMQMEYKNAFCTLQELWIGDNQAIAKLHSVIQNHAQMGSYIYPEMLDGALQSTIGFYIAGQKKTDKSLVPFAIDEVRVLRPCTQNMWAVLQMSETADDIVKFDIALCDEEGNVCVTVIQYASKALENHMDDTNRSVQEKCTDTDCVDADIYKAVWKESRDGLSEQENMKRIVLAQNWDELLVQMIMQHEEVQCEKLNSAPKGTAINKRYEQLAAQVFKFIKNMFFNKLEEKTLLQVVLKTNDRDIALEGIAGLLRTAQLENPLLSAQIIHVTDDLDSAKAIDMILKEDGSKKHIRYLDGARWVKMWSPVPKEQERSLTFRNGGAYVITGGLGVLGMALTEEIVRNTKDAAVLLLGRSAITDEQNEKIDKLCKSGNAVKYRQADITDAEAVKNCISEFSKQCGGICGVFHCAGKINDQYILNKSEPEFAQVLLPKVSGLYFIDEVLKDEKLDFFICFSSTSGCFGNAGQCDYAAANEFMNCYMERRSKQVQSGKRFGSSISICWPLWKNGGMQVSDEVINYMYDTSGLLPVSTVQGMKALSTCMQHEGFEFVIMNGNAEKYKRLLE